MFEIHGVARSQRRTTRAGNGRDLGIGLADRAAQPASCGSNSGESSTASLSKGRNAAFEAAVEGLASGIFQLRSAAAGGKKRNPKQNFGLSNGSDEELLPRIESHHSITRREGERFASSDTRLVSTMIIN